MNRFPAGEIWKEERSRGRIRVMSADKKTVIGEREDGEVVRIPRGEFETRYRIVLENDDFLRLKGLRTRWLIGRYRKRLQGKSVLELGAHTGAMTARILKYARRTTVIENNPRCVALLKNKFGRRIQVIAGDAHHELWRLPPGRFDVILCAGLLYHSAHPFLLLEAMAFLAPELILIDTLNAKAPKDAAELRTEGGLNGINYRYNAHKDCGMSLVLGSNLILRTMERLGYRTLEQVDKSGVLPGRRNDDAYFRAWKNGFSAWFERTKEADF